MSNLGVFHWIRESVKRSVLLGFSDAVEQLGVPTDANDVSPQLLAVLRQAPTAVGHMPSGQPQGKSERRRLGRSLDQIRDTTVRPAADSET